MYVFGTLYNVTVECEKINDKHFKGMITYSESRDQIFVNKLKLLPGTTLVYQDGIQQETQFIIRHKIMAIALSFNTQNNHGITNNNREFLLSKIHI